MRLNEEGQVLLGDPGVEGCRDKLKEFEFEDEDGAQDYKGSAVPGGFKPESRSSDPKLTSKELKSSNTGLIKEQFSVSKQNPEKHAFGSLQSQVIQPMPFTSSPKPTSVYGAAHPVYTIPTSGSQYTNKSSHRNGLHPKSKQNILHREFINPEKPRSENAYLASSVSRPSQPRVIYSSVT